MLDSSNQRFPAGRVVASQRSLSASKKRIFIIHGSHFLTDHLFHGDGLVAWGFIDELARRGHRVHVATDRLDVRAHTPPNLTLIEFPRVHPNSVLHYLSYMRKVRAYYDRLAATEGVDVVHQMNPVVRGISLSLLGREVPIVLGTYVGDWVRLKSSPDYTSPTRSERFNACAKAAVDAVQQHFASSLILATPHALARVPLSFDVWNKIEFMHHGVDTELFNPARLPADPPRVDRRILFVGSVHRFKGVLTLADAFARVVRFVETASLVMVGSGSVIEIMKHRLAELGVAERVTFVGRAARTDVAGWMRSCDVVCSPSFGEPYGQNVLEAMASGKPVVATTQGGHRHIGDSRGLLRVEPGNVERLAAALTAILLDPARGADMGRHNREIAENCHAWPKVTDRLEEIYERAIVPRLV
jgi:glycosyltransferase involved in cell wall biosynthesis